MPVFTSNPYKFDMPDSLKEKQTQKAINQAVKFLQSQGITVT